MPGNDPTTSARDAAGELVAALSALRARAGEPSSRQIASKVADGSPGERISHTTVADALSGRRVPSWPAVAAIVRALGGDEQTFQRTWVAATDRPATPTTPEREDVLFITRYRRLVASYYNSSTPGVGVGRGRFFDVYEPPQIVKSSPLTDRQSTLDISAFDGEIRHALMLGSVASGKTMLCWALMLLHALDETKPTPFLISVRDFASHQLTPARSVAGSIEHHLESVFQRRPPTGLIERHLRNEPTLVMFDGLDDVFDRGQAAHIASIIQLFSLEYPLARILVTSADESHGDGLFDADVFTTYSLSGTGVEASQMVREPLSSNRMPTGVLDDLKAIRELLNRFGTEPAFGPAVIALSWATLERYLKQRLIGAIEERGLTWSDETPLELYGARLVAVAQSQNLIAPEDAEQLRSSWALRNQVVHGLEPPAATSSQLVNDAVEVVIRAIRHLYEDVVIRP